MTGKKGYSPSDYSFMICLMCTNEEEVATAMEKLTLPITGLALDGINVMFMRMSDLEDDEE